MRAPPPHCAKRDDVRVCKRLRVVSCSLSCRRCKCCLAVVRNFYDDGRCCKQLQTVVDQAIVDNATSKKLQFLPKPVLPAPRRYGQKAVRAPLPEISHVLIHILAQHVNTKRESPLVFSNSARRPGASHRKQPQKYFSMSCRRKDFGSDSVCAPPSRTWQWHFF